eukprot:4430324-Pleurochrysis_carterae.AAC.1
MQGVARAVGDRRACRAPKVRAGPWESELKRRMCVRGLRRHAEREGPRVRGPRSPCSSFGSPLSSMSSTPTSGGGRIAEREPRSPPSSAAPPRNAAIQYNKHYNSEVRGLVVVVVAATVRLRLDDGLRVRVRLKQLGLA